LHPPTLQFRGSSLTNWATEVSCRTLTSEIENIYGSVTANPGSNILNTVIIKMVSLNVFFFSLTTKMKKKDMGHLINLIIFQFRSVCMVWAIYINYDEAMKGQTYSVCRYTCFNLSNACQWLHSKGASGILNPTGIKFYILGKMLLINILINEIFNGPVGSLVDFLLNSDSV
jgi:hypothetical protein